MPSAWTRNRGSCSMPPSSGNVVKPGFLATLRRPAILQLLACAVLGATAVFAGASLLERERRANRQALDELGDIRLRLARIEAEAVDIPGHAERYRQMIANGHLGPERRLEWIERIAAIKAERRLLDLRYEFSAQKALDATAAPVGASASGFEFMSSTMKLRMDLLHEDDLLGFLDDLASGVSALLRARACTLERLAAEPGGGTAAQLRADCTIDWITLKEKT